MLIEKIDSVLDNDIKIIDLTHLFFVPEIDQKTRLIKTKLSSTLHSIEGPCAIFYDGEYGYYICGLRYNYETWIRIVNNYMYYLWENKVYG